MKTKFNPNNKDTLTYGDCLGPAMEITELEDAIQYKKDYVAFIQKELDKKPNENGLSAEEIANSNLGYYAGYYSDKVRERVELLFNCSHPVFGSIKTNGKPTGKEAFECGRQSKTLNEIRNPKL